MTLARILALPRSAPVTPELVDTLSQQLRVRTIDAETGEENRLRPQQVQLIRDVLDIRGAVAHMPVGTGKTLPTLLLPTVLGALRPTLMLPASLREKTLRDFAAYRKNWRIRLPELLSYSEMSMASREHYLFESAPDLLMADECDPLMRSNACARRTERYLDVARPVFVPMSGTYIGTKLAKYSGLTTLALRGRAPVPALPAEQERWGQAIDNQIRALVRPVVGELTQIPGGFHRWFRESAGVICGRGVECGASIRASTWSPPIPERLAKLVREVAVTGLRPDGVVLSEFELPDVLCQIALGFYYVWDPLPPVWWLHPRRGWNSYVRAVLEAQLIGFDTTSMIVAALDNPRSAPQPPGAHDARVLLAAWRAVADAFKPTPVPVWVDDTPIRQIVRHATPRDTLIWCHHSTALAPKFAELGVPYYGGGTDPETAPPGKTIAVSIRAHHRGQNLQAWGRALITKLPGKHETCEQLIGRIHRSRQKRPYVVLEILDTIDYHGAVLDRVMADARAISKGANVPHKLVLADWA